MLLSLFKQSDLLSKKQKSAFMLGLSITLALPSAEVIAQNSADSVPEIPVEDFFSNTLYTDVVISPEGTYYAIKADAGDRDQLMVIRRSDNELTASFELGQYQRFSKINWVTDERFIFESRKRVGLWDEQEQPPNLYAINADGSHRRELFSWGVSGYSLLSMMPNDPDHIMINKYHYSDRGEAKAHRINVNSARSYYMGEQPPKADQLIADNDGNLRLSFAYEEDDEDAYGKGDLSIYFKPVTGGEWKKLELEGYEDGQTLNFYGFSPDNRYAYFGTDFESKVAEVYQFDTQTDNIERLTKDSSSDVLSPVLDVKGDIIGFDFMPDKIKRVYTDNSESTALMKNLDNAFPGQRVSITSSAKDGELAVVYVRSDTNPGSYFLFNTKTMKASFIAAPNKKLDPNQLAPMRPFTITARDGLELPGYITLPKGAEKGDKLPMIVNVHGGPHGPRDMWGFSAENQFFANRGYAVLQVNFRGSGGYGSEFLQAGYGEWGRSMQDDVTDATLWAIEQGYADPERICIYGGSYGGYSAMMGIAKEPDLYQCGVGYVGVYSLPLMYDAGDISRNQSGEKYLERVLGTDMEVLKANSPVNLVEKMKADILLVHGEKDVRVPIEHYNALTQALDRVNKPYQTFVKEDEGHGFQKEGNKFELYKKLETFFDKHIGE